MLAEYIPIIINFLIESLIKPIVWILIPFIIYKVEQYVKRMMESTVERNNKEGLNAITNITTQLIEQLEIIVNAAVSANMSFANSFKSIEKPKLTDEEIVLIKDTCKTLVFSMLPVNVSQGPLLKILGGESALNNLIENLIEKELIEVKVKINQGNPIDKK